MSPLEMWVELAEAESEEPSVESRLASYSQTGGTYTDFVPSEIAGVADDIRGDLRAYHSLSRRLSEH